MLPYFSEEYGNPASAHTAGRTAADAVEKAREQVARAIGAACNTVIFTSGATESNNLALWKSAKGNSERRKVVVSAIEHKSVLGPALRLTEHGFARELVPVCHDGVINVERAAELIDDDTLIVSVQGANNETGVVQPVRELAQLAHSHGAMFHCDAAQTLGKTHASVTELGVDLASFSSHKVYGPKGVGAMFIANAKTRAALTPMLSGGGQEGMIRPGTLNVSGVVGFGRACSLAQELLEIEMLRVSDLRSLCEEILLQGIPFARINGWSAPRLPGTISLTIPGLPADMVMSNLSSVCISDGSACNSGALEPSHVLLAMGLSRSDAECTVRISLGRDTSKVEIEAGCRELVAACRTLQERAAGEAWAR